MKKLLGEMGSHHQPPQYTRKQTNSNNNKRFKKLSKLRFLLFSRSFCQGIFNLIFFLKKFLAKLQTNKFHKMPKGEQYYCKVTHNRNKAVNIGPRIP
jgi:hypothetical protein